MKEPYEQIIEGDKILASVVGKPIKCLTCGHEGDLSNKTLLHNKAWVCNRWQCITNPNTSYQHLALTVALQEGCE